MEKLILSKGYVKNRLILSLCQIGEILFNFESIVSLNDNYLDEKDPRRGFCFKECIKRAWHWSPVAILIFVVLEAPPFSDE